MRSLSTSAFGQPSETKLIFGAAPSAFVSESCMEEGLAAIEGKIKEQLRSLIDSAWKMQWFPEIDEQDHARIGSIVPGLVLIRVIENDNLTLPPAVDLVFDTNTEPFARFGDDQPKVQPQHTIVWTAMCGQMLAWVEDRKRCGN